MQSKGEVLSGRACCRGCTVPCRGAPQAWDATVAVRPWQVGGRVGRGSVPGGGGRACLPGGASAARQLEGLCPPHICGLPSVAPRRSRCPTPGAATRCSTQSRSGRRRESVVAGVATRLWPS